jgi:hypothetical protein
MNASVHGNIQSPASNGESPRTSWRYCGKKKKPPNMMRMVSPYVATDAENPGARNSRMSMRGSASVSCRLTNSTPSVTPTTIDSIAFTLTPSWAICFRP